MASASTSFTTSTSSLFSSFSSNTPNHTRHTPPSYVTFRRPLPPISAVYTTAEESASVGVASNVSLQTASFYEVLGIPAGASGKEIKAAYRKLARVIHPDAVASSKKDSSSLSLSSSSSSSSSPAEEFIRVHEAYATLSDPKKRADYDRMMWVKGRRLSYYSPTYCTPPGSGANKYGSGTTSSSGFSGYTRRRTWETDQCW